MKKLIAIVLLVATSVFGANLCIGPAATGTGSGADWNNLKAWSGTPNRGDTWYLVTGSYSGKSFSTAASGSTMINVKKATVADHGGISAGWQDSYGNGQAVFTAPLSFTTSFWLFDGVVGPMWSTNVTDYGFNLTFNMTSGQNIGIAINSSARKLSNITISHVSSVVPNPSLDVEKYFVAGIDGTFGADNVTLSHCYARYWENMEKASSGATQTNWVTEYNIFKETSSTPSFHGEDINSAYSDMKDWTIRYNWFEGTLGPPWSPTGIIVVLNGPSSGNFLIYGNVFKDKWTSDGKVGGIHYIMHGVFVHNTMINCFCGSPGNLYPYDNWVIPVGGDAGNNMTVLNNLIASERGDRGGSGTIVSNAYYNCAFAPSETGRQILSTVPFINTNANNLNLAYNTQPGATLSAPYDVDAYGNTRSTWSRGAFEYNGSPTAPSISVQPAAQNVQVGQQFALSVTASGTAPLAYSWRLNGTPVTGATTSSYVKNNAQVGDSGNYTAVITNIAGGITSSVAAVSVTNPAVAIIGVSPGSLNFGVNPTNTVTTLTFNVYNTGSGGLSGSASASAPFAVTAGSPYNVSAGNSTPITVTYTPTANAWQDSGSVTLTGGGGTNVPLVGTAYSLQNPTGTISMNGATTNGGLTLSSGVFYESADVSGPDQGGEAIVGFSVAVATNIWMVLSVEATNISNNSLFVDVDGLPESPANIFDVTNLTTGIQARGVSWRGAGDTSTPQYPTNIWSIGAGPHYVMLCGREPMRWGDLLIQPLSGATQSPLITVQPQSQSVYVGNPATFTVQASGSVPLSYQWNFGGSPIGGANQSIYVIDQTSFASSGQYSCTVTNSAGSANSFAVTLTVLPSPYAGSPSNTTVIIQ